MRNQVHVSVVSVALIMLLLPQVGGAQSSQTEVDEFVVYHSALKADRLPDASTERHDIEDEADNILVTIAIHDTKANENVHANLRVTATNLNEQLYEIPMSPSVANGMISYTGVVDVTLPANLDFDVEFTPEGRTQTYEISFSEYVYAD